MNHHDPNNQDCNYDETKPTGSQLCNEIYNYCTCPPAADEVAEIREMYLRELPQAKGVDSQAYLECIAILLRIVDQQAAELANCAPYRANWPKAEKAFRNKIAGLENELAAKDAEIERLRVALISLWG